MKWFDGAWSRFKPGLGKDKRGVSGVDKTKLIDIGKKITNIPKNFEVHKTSCLHNYCKLNHPFHLNIL